MKLPPDLEAKCLELAGEKPAAGVKPTRKRRTAALPAKCRWAVVLTPPCRLLSEANIREHWAARRRREQSQRECVRATWRASPLPAHPDPEWLFLAHGPITVTFVHTGPRMDDDNLARAGKACRDELAKLIGVDDGDDRVRWRYEQRAGTPGLEIRIEGEA